MEEIANKIVQAIKSGKSRLDAEREFIPDDISEIEKCEINRIVDSKLNEQLHKARKYRLRSDYNDYSMEM